MTHNGWKNYETWATYSWMMNDEPNYLKAIEIVRTLRNGPAPALPVVVGDTLKAWVENSMIYTPSFKPHGLAADLMAAALEEIDWREIALNLIDADTEA